MPQILVPVDIITCIAPIIAEPGDHLMVLNGVCLGVHTAHTPKPNGTEVSPPPLKLLPPPPPAKAKRSKFRINVATQERMSTLLKLLANKGPLHFRDIHSLTGLTRAEVNVATGHLDRKHLLTKPRKRGTGHQRLYQLREGTPT